MLTIKGLVKMRKMLGIRGQDIADEMSTTKQTISNIELERAETTMSTRFYRLTVLKMVENIDKEIKDNLKYELENIIKYLESGKDEI